MLSQQRKKMPFYRPIAGAALLLSGCSAMVHTAPHSSVELVLAKRPDVVRMAETMKAEPRLTGYRLAHVPPVEPDLPTNDRIEAVAETFTRGKEAFEAGKNAEAINAFEEATKLDPEFADAWEYLARAHEAAGQREKAKAAYQQAKQHWKQ
jgi:tetratricopeptide (TPR) repeat protein